MNRARIRTIGFHLLVASVAMACLLTFCHAGADPRNPMLLRILNNEGGAKCCHFLSCDKKPTLLECAACCKGCLEEDECIDECLIVFGGSAADSVRDAARKISERPTEPWLKERNLLERIQLSKTRPTLGRLAAALARRGEIPGVRVLPKG